MEIRSKNWWEGATEDTKEIKLSMLSIADHYSKIETEIAKLHSYETFVIKMLPITQLNEAAVNWLKKSTE